MALGLSFAFDASKETPQDVARRRAIAEAIMGRSLSPRNVGEGFGAIADGIVGYVENSRASEAEQMGRSGADATRARLVSLLGGGAGSSGGAAANTNALGAVNSVGQATPTTSSFSGSQQEFIDLLMPTALEVSAETSIDPRIIIAQAAQETGWGKSAPGNNFFGIKSHGKPGGQTFNTHEYVNGQRVNIADSFRTFESPEDSVRGYGEFIRTNPRYRDFMSAQGLDAQLEALGASGYATDPNYASSVGSIARGIALPQQPTQVASLDPGILRDIPATAGNIDPGILRTLPDGVQNIDPGILRPMPDTPAQNPASGLFDPGLAMGNAQPQQVAQAGNLPMQPQAPQPRQAPGSDVPIEFLMEALSSPWVDDATKAVASQLLQQQLAPPPGPIKLGQNDVLLDPNTYQPIYQPQPDPGWRALSPEEAAAYGIPAGTPAQINEGTGEVKGLGGVNVTTNVGGESGPKLGSLSTDYGYVHDPESGQPVFDPETGLPTAAPVPGSPAAREIEAARAQAESREAQTATQAGTVTQDAGIALQGLGELGGLSADNGPAGANWRRLQAGIAGTPEHRIQTFVNSALANVGFDQLNQMRQNSPTGGALGNVTELQLRQLESVLGQYDIGLPLEDQKFILQRISNIYSDIIFGSRAERDQAVREGKMTQEEADRYDRYYYPETRDPMGRPIEKPSGPNQSQANPDVVDWTEFFNQ